MKKTNRKESGRSMVEMILTISIILLLIIGGLFGGKKLITGFQANAINKHILSMLNQRRLNMSAIDGQSAKRTEKGPYDISLTIENGTGSNNPSYFWISGNFTSKDLCQKIASFEMESTKPEKVEINNSESGSCPGTVKLYFDKYVNGTSGSSGTESGDGTTPTPTNCTTSSDCSAGKLCVSGNCSGDCTSGNTCASCPSSKPYWNGTNCVNNATTCTTDKNCSAGKLCVSGNCSGDCTSGNTCASCPSSTPIWDGTNCKCNTNSCGSGNYCSSSGICNTCATPIEKCNISDNITDSFGCISEKRITCSGSTPACDSDGKTCICPSNATCSSNGTFTCNTGYYKNGNSCSSCNTPEEKCNITADTIDSTTGCTTQKKITCSDTTPVCNTSGNCECDSTSCESGNYCNSGTCNSCSPTYTAETLCRGTSTNYGNGCPQTKIETCSTDMPVCSSSNSCTPCPTSTTSITVLNSGDCKNNCSNAIETLNDDNTYTCSYCISSAICNNTCCGNGRTCDTDTTSTTYNTCVCPSSTPYWNPETNSCSATPNCYAVMTKAGYDPYYFSVSGNTVVWNPNKDSSQNSMTISDNLDLKGCDLTINGYLSDNTSTLTVNNLKINLTKTSTNSGTIKILENLDLLRDDEFVFTIKFKNTGNINIQKDLNVANTVGAFDQRGSMTVNGNIISLAGFLNNGTTEINGYIESQSSVYNGIFNDGTLISHSYIKGTSTNENTSGSSEDGIRIYSGSIIAEGDIIGSACETDINCQGISVFNGYSSDLMSITSNNGNIIGTGGTGIKVNNGEIYAKNGYIEGTGKKYDGIYLDNSLMEAKRNITGNSKSAVGIATVNSTIRAGGEIYGNATENGTAGVAFSYGTTAISCSGLTGTAIGGASVGITFGNNDTQVKGEIYGSCSRTDGYTFGNHILVTTNINGIHARSFNTKYTTNRYTTNCDYNPCELVSGYYMSTYPSNPTYTPEWCTENGF